MRKFLSVSLLTLSSLLAFSNAQAQEQKEFKYIGNPLVRHVFTADPTARVFNDRLYVYTSHDRQEADYYTMTDWHVFSTDDMKNWVDHGAFFGLDDIPWAESMAWAPDCVERDGKYYFYYPVERAKIGVAVSDNPTSGFKDSGAPLIDKAKNEKLIGPEPIDPSVIIEDGEAYMFFGCREFRMVQLDESMTKTKGKVKKVEILGNEGHEQNNGGYYGEGPFAFKRGDTFYMVYSNGWGNTSTMVYATSDKVEGPYTYQGEIIPNVGCSTSHGSLVEFKDEWYIFYHTQDLSGKGHRRSVAFDRISFDKDGKIKKAVQTRSALSQGEDYYNGKGRIAISSDGNKHDNDDMQASMMTLMILAEANLQSKTTLYTYADHIWGSEGNDLEIMKVSTEVCGEKFGFTSTNFMAAVEDPEKAYNAMRDEILKSTADDPLFILAAGPMQVVGEAINRAMKIDPNSLNYITVISHSIWNEIHADNHEIEGSVHGEEEPHSGWVWNEMVDAFGDRANFIHILDQNGTGVNPYKTKNKFAAPSWNSWEWMRTSKNPNIRWVYEQGVKNPCGPDYSDAGLAYYLCGDLDGKRGDQNGNPAKLRDWMNH
ncbi:MAG: family 43 glycosylhydrolase [Rikenellaceae bacterium]